MSLTVKDVLIKAYSTFIDETKSIVDKSLFPNVEEIDLSDLFFLIDYYFPQKCNVKESIKRIFELKQLNSDDETLEKMEKPVKKLLEIIEKIKNIKD